MRAIAKEHLNTLQKKTLFAIQQNKIPTHSKQIKKNIINFQKVYLSKEKSTSKAFEKA